MGDTLVPLHILTGFSIQSSNISIPLSVGRFIKADNWENGRARGKFEG